MAAVTDIDLAALPQILTVQEYAALVRLTRVTVQAQCRDGRIKGAFRVGWCWRIPRTALPKELIPPPPSETARQRAARGQADLDFIRSLKGKTGGR